MNITIKEVAERAGVSQSTVSLVLNHKKSVRESTRKKVLQVIEEMDFHPQRSARTLASKRTGNIGFVISDIHFTRAEPFYTRIFLGCEFEARHFDYYILLTSVGEAFSRKNLPRFLKEGNVDGVIAAGSMNDKWLYEMRKMGIPVVLIDYYPPRLKWPCVLIDNIEGGREAVRYLLELGHEKIAFIGGSAFHPSIQGRYQGYLMAMEEHGLNGQEWVVRDEIETRVEDGYNATKKLLMKKERPTALFAANDAMATGALKAIREKGLKVPDDISVIGFDNIEVTNHTDPPLTTMSVRMEEMGAKAVNMIHDIIDQKKSLQEKILVPVDLVKRSSCRAI
ncbi:MAG: LacI family transcriptional regulator [Calditrichaeota bacterium]|nr:LacI family transcriptional regulator [Calditrichota bacterium]